MATKEETTHRRTRLSVTGLGLLAGGGLVVVAGTPYYDGKAGQSPLDAFEGWLDGDSPSGLQDARNNLYWQLNPLSSGAADGAWVNDLTLIAGAALQKYGRKVPGLSKIAFHTKDHTIALV